MRYYQRVLLFAVRLWMRRMRDGRQKLIGFILQTTVVFAVLYYMPIFGDLAENAGAVGSTVIAVLASGAFYFLYDLWRSPVLIDEYQREDIGYCVTAAKEIMASEEKLRFLGKLHAEGMVLADAKLPYKELLSGYQDWLARAEAYLEANFEYAKLHDFKNAKPRHFSTHQATHPQQRAHNDLLLLLEAKVEMLDRTISLGGGVSVLPSILFNGVIERSHSPIYRYLAPIEKSENAA